MGRTMTQPTPAAALDARLVRYFEDVRAIAAQPLSPSAKVRRVRELASALVAAPLVVGPEFRRFPERGYGRNLLYRDPDHGFVVIAMVWPPASGGLPHDHGTWGVVAVAEGEVEVTNFEREDDGRDETHASLRSLGVVHGRPGATATVLPPHEDFHSVRNPSRERFAMTIHTYGCEPADFHRVDLASGAMSRGTLAYDNVRAG